MRGWDIRKMEEDRMNEEEDGVGKDWKRKGKEKESIDQREGDR